MKKNKIKIVLTSNICTVSNLLTNCFCLSFFYLCLTLSLKYVQLQNQSELRAYSAERAAFFLDAALAARSTSRSDCKEEDRWNSHMLFTLHISQYRMEKSTKAGSMAHCVHFRSYVYILFRKTICKLCNIWLSFKSTILFTFYVDKK